jgi:predicted RNA-binding Zn-ribbon protein involved in translation (DUF1610 family)
MSRKDKSGKKSAMDDLIPLVRELERIKEQARVFGIFTDDRELLECSKCGFLEDVAAGGLLMTYPKASKEMKDCGLRFRPVDESTFECPSCGTRIKAVIL